MCGIFAILKAKGTVSPDITRHHCLSLLADRGPDSSSYFLSPKIFIFHSLLKITNADGDTAQPIETSRTVTACNGQIFNFRDLLRSDQDLSSSDCLSLNVAYEKSGVEGFKSLDGFFSFILLDKKKNKFFFGKDSIGKKPLFFFKNDQEIIVSSSFRAIFLYLGRDILLDSTTLQTFVNEGFVDPRRTLDREISAVWPGELYELDLDSFEMTRDSVHRTDLKDATNDTTADDISSLISSGLAKRLAGHKQVNLLFSGGIDSTLLAAMIQQQGVSIKAWTIDVEGQNFDTPFVRKAQQKLGFLVNYVDIYSDFATQFLESIKRMDQPVGITAHYILHVLGGAIKRDGTSKVVLTGDGADEVFYGYAPLERWRGHDRESAQRDFYVGGRQSMPLSDYGYYQRHIALAGHAFQKLDSAICELGLEVRCPYLDSELVIALNKDPKYWISHAEQKLVLKKELAKFGFDHEFLFRKKVGFSSSVIKVFYLNLLNVLKVTKKGTNIFGLVSLAVTLWRFTGGFKLNPMVAWRIFVLREFLADLDQNLYDRVRYARSYD